MTVNDLQIQKINIFLTDCTTKIFIKAGRSEHQEGN